MRFKFGTDGWRNRISFGFNYENVRLVSLAIAKYFHESFSPSRVAVGYDTRFLSDSFALEAWRLADSLVDEAVISSSFVTSPMLSRYIVANGLSGGIMVTASHNPYVYDGLKIKSCKGSSAGPDEVAIVERILEQELSNYDGSFGAQAPLFSFDGAKSVDMVSPYVQSLTQRFAPKFAGAKKLRVCLDPMHGASQVGLPRTLTELGLEVAVINGHLDPHFGGVNPEPIEKNLADLKKAMSENYFDMGVALDGDGDRIGLFDERGRFLNSHQIFAISLWYLADVEGLRGRVVKTVTTSDIVSRIASEFGLEVVETPVGFKYVAEEILSGGVLIGGEESGGIWAQGDVPERDGIYMACFVCSIVAQTGRSLAQIFDEVSARFGLYWYERLDIDFLPEQRKSVERALQRLVERLGGGKFAGLRIKKVNSLDGHKLIFDDGEWVMFRLSGTEDVLRIYCESRDRERLSKVLTAARELVMQEG